MYTLPEAILLINQGGVQVSKKLNGKIVAMLYRLKERAMTEEGKKQILDNFNEKIRRVGGIEQLIYKLKLMYSYFQSPDVPAAKKGLVGAALLYFLLPTDVLFDGIPIIGYMDDFTAVMWVWRFLSKELEEFEQKIQTKLLSSSTSD